MTLPESAPPVEKWVSPCELVYSDGLHCHARDVGVPGRTVVGVGVMEHALPEQVEGTVVTCTETVSYVADDG